MAQTKKELLAEAHEKGIEVDPALKVADIRELLTAATVNEAAIAEEVTEAEPSEEAKEVATAKAGKRSAKALAEDAEKLAKEERKAHGDEEKAAPKVDAPPTRSRTERKGKGYKKSAGLIDNSKKYSVEDATKLAKQTSHVKFDATVELHINLGVDPRHADQNIRDTVVLPAGNGKTIRIAVLTDEAAAAKAAGADIAGNEDFLAQLEKGVIDFDVLITTPNQMSKLGKYARTLGPRGLMPNPKRGTVTTDIAKAVAEAKAGRVEYRVDSTGIIHLGVGKVSFTESQLNDNIAAIMASVKSNKPQNIKGNYIRAIYISTTMGPSVPIDIATIG